MKLTFLGTGTSGGVPSIGCQCDVCRSSDPRDHRLRASALVETTQARILIDCGPDFRQQILSQPFRPFTAVLLTHIHYDHVGGIDDLRPYCYPMTNPRDPYRSSYTPTTVNIYANEATAQALHQTMPYCFAEHLYRGAPMLNLHTIGPHQPLRLADVEVMPVEVMHGQLPILGFRMGPLAYITDMKTIHPAELAYLKGVDTLVVNALRFDKEHPTHQTVAQAIDFARQIDARQTWLIHMSHHAGLHADSFRKLPDDVRLAYDGLTIDI